MTTGIYILTSPTNKIYVGQSINIENRIKNYQKPSGATKQRKLKASIKKYGWDAHTFEVIMPLREDISPEMMTYWEQFFMDYYKSEGYELMNLKGASSKGKMHPSSKIKLIDSISGSKHHASRPVNQYTLGGKFVTRWCNVSTAAKCLGLYRTGIYKCCNNDNINTAYGYVWAYVCDGYPQNKFKKDVILQISTSTGDIAQVWNSTSDVANAFNVGTTSVSRWCTGERRASNGYKWIRSKI